MPLQLRVHSIRKAAPRVVEIDLRAADGGALPAFTAGAHIDLVLGNGIERSYSLLNDPREAHRYVTGVLRETDSKGGSVWLHDNLKPGDLLTSSEPINHFPLNEAGGHHILIAGGIGITPLLSMAHRLNAISADYRLHYCARTRDEAAFVAEAEALAGSKLTMHCSGGDMAKRLDVGTLLKQRPAAAHVYVCGPVDLVRAAREATSD